MGRLNWIVLRTKYAVPEEPERAYAPSLASTGPNPADDKQGHINHCDTVAHAKKTRNCLPFPPFPLRALPAPAPRPELPLRCPLPAHYLRHPVHTRPLPHPTRRRPRRGCKTLYGRVATA